MQQRKHRTVFRSVTSRAPPRAACRAAAARALSRWPKHIAKSRRPCTCLHLTILLAPPLFVSLSLSLSPFRARARRRAQAGAGAGGKGGAQDAFADTLCYYFHNIIRKVQARPRQPPPRPHPLLPPQLPCMLLRLRPSHFAQQIWQQSQ
jgi:hypothetical protein